MKTITLLTLAMFVVGAIAAPAMADPDHADDRRQDAKDKADDRASKRDEAMEKRDAHAAKHDERRNATIAKAQERCEQYEERTGRDLKACDRLEEVHDEPKSARRAAHALMKAIDALEHRIVTLEKLEVKFMEKLEGDNLTANQTAAYEAKIVRIQAAQNKTLDKIEKMEDRLEGLKAKWDKIRDHVDDHKKVLVCHQGDDGNKTLRISKSAAAAHQRHNDTLGPCPDSDVSFEDDAAESEEDASEAQEGSEEQSAEPASDGSEEQSEGDAGEEPEEESEEPAE